MIRLYCEDVSCRAEYHKYYRDRGVSIEATPPGHYISRSFFPDTQALLVIGVSPPGLYSRLNPHVPVFCVGEFQIGDAIFFEDYRDPELLEDLLYISADNCLVTYNDNLFITLRHARFLGYEIELTPTENSILRTLASEPQKIFESEELLELCIGDVYRKKSNISQHISEINRKAIEVGGRPFIYSPDKGCYRMRKYI